MNKFILIIICFFISSSSFSQVDEDVKIKYRKLDYNDFVKLSVNDTSAVIIDIFYDKKDNAALGQMSFLPISAVVTLIPLTRPIGFVLSIISTPLFINGSYMLVKYRKKKLYMVLVEYEKTRRLPKWVRRKANKQLEFIELIKLQY